MTPRTKVKDKMGTHQLAWLRVGKIWVRPPWSSWLLQEDCRAGPRKSGDRWPSLRPHFSERNQDQGRQNASKITEPVTAEQELVSSFPRWHFFSYQTQCQSLPQSSHSKISYFRQPEQASGFEPLKAICQRPSPTGPHQPWHLVLVPSTSALVMEELMYINTPSLKHSRVSEQRPNVGKWWLKS